MSSLIAQQLPVIYIGLWTIFAGFSINLVLRKTGEKWCDNKNSIISMSLLPFITYSITQVISGNIALSLGMVGALSIVRFRNPVRSSYELVILFALISLGIISNVNFLMSLIFVLLILCCVLIGKFFIKSENLSFDIQKDHFSIEVISYEQIDFLEKNKNTNFFSIDHNNEEKEFIYHLSSNKRSIIEDLLIKIREPNIKIKKINVNF